MKTNWCVPTTMRSLSSALPVESTPGWWKGGSSWLLNLGLRTTLFRVVEGAWGFAQPVQKSFWLSVKGLQSCAPRYSPGGGGDFCPWTKILGTARWGAVSSLVIWGSFICCLQTMWSCLCTNRSGSQLSVKHLESWSAPAKSEATAKVDILR